MARQPPPRAPRFVDPVSQRPLAEWWKRALALLLDLSVVGVPLYVILEAVSITQLLNTSIQCNDVTGVCAATGPSARSVVGWLAVFWVLSLVVFGAYLVSMTGRPRGQTVGMMALGIAVRDERDDRSIGYVRAFGRAGLLFLLLLPLGIPLLLDMLSPLWDRRRQAWHDHAAGSVVTELR